MATDEPGQRVHASLDRLRGAPPGTEDKSADRDTDPSAGEPGPVSDPPRRPQPPSTVTLVELRPPAQRPETRLAEAVVHALMRERTDGQSRRFWRQQACGPGWSQRKPVYVVEHERGGPRDAPPLLPKDRVHVLRR